MPLTGDEVTQGPSLVLRVSGGGYQVGRALTLTLYRAVCCGLWSCDDLAEVSRGEARRRFGVLRLGRLE